MKELQAHAVQHNLSVAQLGMANEMAVSGKCEAEINAFLDKIYSTMVSIVKTGLTMPVSTLPGPIKLKTKAGEVYRRAMDDTYETQRGVGLVAAYALVGSEENARGHLVITAPTGGSAGVIPAIAYALGEGGRNLPQEKIRQGLMAAAVIGYLCKHNATLSGAEGGCQAEIGVASAMGAALIAQAHDFDHQVVANAAESALEHHLGMTCDPVAGYVQIPCIERCAFGAVKAWTGFMIASNEIPIDRRVDFDTTVAAMALTAREMNSKYKETSEGGLAVSLVLC
jgi:L-serine dehydratase